MNTFIQAVTVLLPTLYLITAVLYGMTFAGERQPHFALRLRRPLFFAVMGLHLVLFIARGCSSGRFPLSSVWMTVSATALFVAALFALVTLRLKVPGTGGTVLGMVVVLQGCASAFGPLEARSGAAVDSVTIVHILTIALAAAALILSGLFGFLHLVMLRQMSRKQFGPIYRELPDLEQLTRMMRKTALWGFLFMALGLNIGIALAHARHSEGFRYLNPHVLMAIAIWFHFGAIAFSRHIPGLTARKTSVAAVWGLIILLATIAITLIPAPFHQLS